MEEALAIAARADASGRIPYSNGGVGVRRKEWQRTVGCGKAEGENSWQPKNAEDGGIAHPQSFGKSLGLGGEGLTLAEGKPS